MARISSRAFTLIELLIVIAIIGILMALLFPAVNGAIDAARKAQAKNDVTQIATAVVAYETEYGKLPGLSGSSSDSTVDVGSSLVNILTGQDLTENPRKIVFIEIGQWKKNSKSGTNAGGNFLDPWGNQYKVTLDGNYDNNVSGGTNNQTIRKKVAVWNNSTNGTTAQKTRRYVTSWE